MKNTILLTIGALLLTLLSGCATNSYQPDHRLPIKTSIAELDNWKINAKLGIQTATDAQSIYINWQQQSDKYQLRLNGPLGFGSVYIVGDSNQAEIKKGNQRITTNPQQLTMQLTGIPVPITALNWWVKGLLSPDYTATQIKRAPTGKLDSFIQAGWQISILSYVQKENYWMPKKISGRQGKLSFKLIISDWDFSEKAAE